METLAQDLKAAVQTLTEDTRFCHALASVKDRLPETIRDQKELTLIEAPTGHEEKKARRYMQMLEEAGLTDVVMDEHFNVFGKVTGSANSGKSVLLEGHLDTVFSFGDVKEIREDEEGRLHCPGICDDTRALAANLAVLRALKDAGLKPVHDIYFAGTVREEGLGGMQGMAWVLDELKEKTELLATLSIDGPSGETFYANATGIVDWEVTFEGPGGHAWTACERPSAIHAAALAIAEMTKIKVPTDPKTTFTVSLIEGGQAIHGIAQKATFKINARSNSQEELNRLDDEFIRAFEAGAEAENPKDSCSGRISVTYRKILDVPAGSQPDNARIIQLTKLATLAVGREPNFLPGGCTNTNMAIARNIPAVTLGRGGEEYGTHTLNEWFNPKDVFCCEQKSPILLGVIAGIEGTLKPLGETL